jgi:regulatory protein YycI of two-component signal transduction system YycFG
MQNIFSKIDKKILIIVGIIAIIILIAIFFAFKYSKLVGETVRNEEESTTTGASNSDQIQPSISLEGIQIETDSGLQSDFTICVQQCGDGICQPAGTICIDNLNCVCAETKMDCPNDCK